MCIYHTSYLFIIFKVTFIATQIVKSNVSYVLHKVLRAKPKNEKENIETKINKINLEIKHHTCTYMFILYAMLFQKHICSKYFAEIITGTIQLLEVNGVGIVP